MHKHLLADIYIIPNECVTMHALHNFSSVTFAHIGGVLGIYIIAPQRRPLGTYYYIVIERNSYLLLRI